MALTTVGWSLFYQSSIKKMPHEFAYSPIGHFLNGDSFFSDDYSLCPIDKNTLTHTNPKLVLMADLWYDLCNQKERRRKRKMKKRQQWTKRI